MTHVIFFLQLLTEISSSSLPELHREFGRFSQITPKLTYHKDQKLDKKSTTSNSPYTNKKGGPDLTITYKLNDEDVIIDLNLNSNLLPNGHYVSYQLPNGSVAIQNFTKETVDLCHFHGHIRNKSNRTFVALSTCESKIRGIVNDEDETYYIENDEKERQHFIYRHTESNRFINNLPREQYLSRRKRDSTPSQQLRKPYNSNRRSSYVELVLVIDNSLYQKMDRNITKIHRYSKDLVNIVNGLYTPLNIFVSLLGVVVWSERDEITVSPMANETLANFLSYRETRLRFDHPNDNAHLLTNVTFNDNVVGKALYGVMCSSKSGGVEKVHSELIGVQAATVAHEMGHNFGMDHDNETECECIDKDAKCIMSPTSSYLPPRHWSSCSINYLAHTLSKGMNYCLKNAPTSIFDPPTCGNGFLEMGEECDCGISENCQKNLCCNPLTCKFTENATCATGECCDLTTCSLKPASVPCRPISGECDLPEFCLGDSEFCPKDVYKRDTEVCKNGQAFCYQGGCSTHDDQCKVLWGQGGRNFETCYPLNQYGNNTGNCGFNHRTMEFTKCLEKDQMCGILHCYSLSGHLEFGDYIAKITSIQLKTASNVYTYCYAAFLNISVAEIDPGMSPNGAKCGDGLMCYNQRCENVTELNEKSVGTKCPEDCRGHGICNSLGHCHCDIGFTGDACEDPGFGGSIDSGPSSDPNVVNAFGRIMLILFCGALPASLLFTLFIIYLKKGGLDTSGIHHTIDTVKNLPHRIRGL